LKKFIITILFFGCTLEMSYAQVGSFAGAFSRLGFSARGMGMSNAMVSDIFGDINGYYNPALATFQEEGLVNLGYSFLSLDRKLNFAGFTKKVKLPNQQKGGAGITLAWINAGVNDIDGRDNDTKQIGMFSTFENAFYLGTAFIINEKVSVGVGFKLYYSKLFENVTSTSFALDFGATYKASGKLGFGFAVKDLGAKYQWSTTDLYGSLGNNTEDKFPVLLDLGATYLLPKNLGITSLALRQVFNPTPSSSSVTISPDAVSNNTIIRLGIEINVMPQVKFRTGLDRIDFNTGDFTGNLEPSFGLGLNKSFSQNVNLGIDYSFQLEPFTHDPVQNIGIVFKFK
jgi:hypothetical protein